MATMIARLCVNLQGMDYVDGNLNSVYWDAYAIGDWARDGVMFCKQYGIMSGSGGMFKPADPITRAAMCKVASVTHRSIMNGRS